MAQRRASSGVIRGIPSIGRLEKNDLSAHIMRCIARLFSAGVRAASADACVINSSGYLLKSDSVDWSLKMGSGQSCIRSFRFGSVVIQTVKLISPPQFGNVRLLGPGFSYTAKSNFHGEDSFAVVWTMVRSGRGRGMPVARPRAPDPPSPRSEEARRPFPRKEMPDGHPQFCPRKNHCEGSSDTNLEATHAASASAAYASRTALPPSRQGSLPTGWLAFAGRESNPLDRNERFQSVMPVPLS
jgi:hypothetical protein